jgi:acetyltransferase-like isoleucine patch superfamily enzyme
MIDSTVKIESNAVIESDCDIGKYSIIGAGAVLRKRTKIGKNTIFGTLSVSEGDNEIGDNTTIHAQCHITKGMHIGNNVFIAPFFIASNTPEITKGHHGTHPEQPQYKRLDGYIEDNVRIGIRVSVVPGIRIGHDSVIDQDCLITKDVPPYSHIRGGKDKIGRPI